MATKILIEDRFNCSPQKLYDLLSDDSWDKANLGSDLEFETQKETFRIAVDVAIAL